MNNCPTPAAVSLDATFEERQKAHEDNLKYWECRYRSAEEVLMRLAYDVNARTDFPTMSEYLRKDILQLRNESDLLQALIKREWEMKNFYDIQKHKFTA